MIDNILKIFTNRIVKEREQRSTYNKYIFNSHLVIFLVMVAGATMINYSSWLKVATEFNIKLVMLVVLSLLSFILTTLKVKTFIQDADAIFLLPLESSYLAVQLKLIRKTVITKIIIAILFIMALLPIINKLEYSKLQLSIAFIWLMTTIIQTTTYKFDLAVYSKITFKDELIIFIPYILLAIDFVFGGSNKLVFAILMLIIILIIFVKTKKIEKMSINWYGASEYDNVRKERYLKFVSMFVDVPINSVKVSRRKYLDILLPKLTKENFKKDNSYNYYYLRIFLRQENTIFLVLRLMIIAILFIVSFRNSYVTAVTLVAYCYLAIIQLTPLYKKINTTIWSYILPVGEKIKINSFKKLLRLVMAVSTLVLLLVAVLINGLEIVILASIIVASFLTNYFINKGVK